MAEIRIQPESRSSNIQQALQGLSDGVTSLVKNHIELIRYEVKEEATQAGKNAAALALFGLITFVGYGLLNITAILFAGWFGGIVAMAITALILTLINLAGGLFAILKILKRFEQNTSGLKNVGAELKKDKQWISQIRNNNSSPQLPAQTS